MPRYKPVLLDARVKRINEYTCIAMNSVLRMDVIEPVLLSLCALESFRDLDKSGK
jgi:hypothetical protein